VGRKLYGPLIKRHNMNAYEAVEVYLHTFLTSTLYADERSASRFGLFTPRKKNTQFPVGLRLNRPQRWSGRDRKKKKVVSTRKSNPGHRPPATVLTRMQDKNMSITVVL
jgi:hypothetical protein